MRRLFLTAAAMVLAGLAALASGCNNAHAKDGGRNADQSSPPLSLFTWVNPQSAYCSRGCVGLAVWADARRVDDGRVREALFILSAYVPDLWPIIERDARSGVRVVVGRPRNPEADGDYNPTTRVITISPISAQSEIEVLASLVAHELVHGAQDHSRADQACQQEVDAYAWEASTWERLKRGTGASAGTGGLDEVARAWHEGSLPRLLSSWPLYRSVCRAP